jgi:hypothetical protein
LPREADRGTAEREDAPEYLELGEPGVRRGDPDVGGQQQLDAEGEAAALCGGDDRLGPVTVQAPRIAAVVGERIPARCDRGTHVDEVQTGGEVVAVGDEHAHPQRVIALQQGVRPG